LSFALTSGNGIAIPRLKLEGVGKFFDHESRKVAALEGISLEVRRGEFCCIVGPSGCGKSTLLNIVAGLDRPDSGTVQAHGIPVEGPGPDRVVIFQEVALFPWLDVWGNVEFGLKNLNLPQAEREARIKKYLDLVHLHEFHHARVHQLSGGMKQRVSLARALAMEPEILLMDEPFSALDPHTRERLQEELQELWAATGATILFVTHGLKEAVALGDRVVLLTTQPGRIQAIEEVKLPRPRSVDDAPVLAMARKLKAQIGQWVDPISREEEKV
jgi:NitT/TauT family transport system ATP-binding protein